MNKTDAIKFDLSNPLVNEILKYGQEIKINVA
jgi:hypothetical protein